MLRIRSLCGIVGVGAVLSGLAGSPQAFAADAPPRPAAGFQAPKAVPTALAKRGKHRHVRRNRPVARAAAYGRYLLNPVRCDGGNYWMSITQPQMYGYGSDANWVSVQHYVYKDEGAGWVLKAYGEPGYARAWATRSSPGTAWILQNGARVPSTVYQYVLWGMGDYKIAHYMRWFDAAGNVVDSTFVWGNHVSYAGSEWACEGMLPA